MLNVMRTVAMIAAAVGDTRHAQTLQDKGIVRVMRLHDRKQLLDVFGYAC